MDAYVLATRLRIPPQLRHSVRRPALVETLERGVEDARCTVVSAPAGYGKTTLLSQWAHISRHPVVWFSIDAGDNDPQRFFHYLATAWERAQPDIVAGPLSPLLTAMLPDVETVLSLFLNVASMLPDRTVFVLDDVHLLDDAALWQALTSLLNQLPPTAHFILSGRGEPPLPLARYRARNEVFELDPAALAFQPDETRAFLHDRMGLTLNSDELRRVQEQLEGWVAGLQLMALAMQRQPNGSGIPVPGGRHRFIADYLHEEMLAYLPDDARSFLLQTSILDRLSGPLCDATTGRGDSQAMLERLERDGLFVQPLDVNREWYRYHRLFARVLQTSLQQERAGEVANLHSRAAHWYFDHNLPEEAFKHALAAGNLDLTIRICERYLFALLHSGELRIAGAWLAALPDEWYRAYPSFKLAQATYLAFSGQVEACVQCVDAVDAELGLTRFDNLEPHRARVTAMRCFMACMQNDIAQAEEHAELALLHLRDDDRSFRADIFHALGDTYRRNGRWQDAQESYLKVLQVDPAPVFPSQQAHVYGALADLALRQGRPGEAARCWRLALATIQDRGNRGRLPLAVTGWVYIRMAEILYEQNDLPGAGTHLAQGLEHAELGGDVRGMTAGYLLRARMNLTAGRVETAAADLDRARPLVEQGALPEWISRFERLQLEIWLAQGRRQSALRWTEKTLRDAAMPQRPESENTWLAISRSLIVSGDTPAIERALALLRDLLHQAEAEARSGIVIETLVLQALAHWQRGDATSAFPLFERALRLAGPEGYVRLFADYGLPMARLLQAARDRGIMPDYVMTLLAACGNTALNGSPEMVIPEPLTDREAEILGLLAAGLTNQEIGTRLFISPQTVKKHTGNIYSKLGVHTRTEAASRARALDLLP